MHQIFSAH